MRSYHVVVHVFEKLGVGRHGFELRFFFSQFPECYHNCREFENGILLNAGRRHCEVWKMAMGVEPCNLLAILFLFLRSQGLEGMSGFDAVTPFACQLRF